MLCLAARVAQVLEGDEANNEIKRSEEPAHSFVGHLYSSVYLITIFRSLCEYSKYFFRSKHPPLLSDSIYASIRISLQSLRISVLTPHAIHVAIYPLIPILTSPMASPSLLDIFIRRWHILPLIPVSIRSMHTYLLSIIPS